MDGIVEAVRTDLEILLGADVDGVMFCNEGDRPYALQAYAGGRGGAGSSRDGAGAAGPAFRASISSGDAGAALAVAVATGASFIREVTTGVYESDMGLWNTDAAGLLRERRRLGAEHVRVLMNVTPGLGVSARPPRGGGGGALRRRVSLADAVLVSGPMQGAEPSLDAVREAKEAVAGAVPAPLNTGAKSTNVREYLAVADGVIVGSDLKVDGYTWNPVDPARVDRFLAAARG